MLYMHTHEDLEFVIIDLLHINLIQMHQTILVILADLHVCVRLCARAVRVRVRVNL